MIWVILGLICGVVILINKFDDSPPRISKWNAGDPRGRGMWWRKTIQIGESPWYECPQTGQKFSKRTGEPVELVTMSLSEFLEESHKNCTEEKCNVLKPSEL